MFRLSRFYGVLIALTLVSAASSAVSASMSTEASLPGGWMLAGSAPRDFDMGASKLAHSGKSSGFLKSKTAKPGGFGTLMQICKADAYHGKRVRMSAWVRADKVAGWSGVWMRVDGPEANKSLAFDNMQSRPIRGTQGWSKYDVVLDVAPEATKIAFGILLDGSGGVWIDDVAFDEVDRSVPTTDVMKGGASAVQTRPENLGFEQ